MMISILSECSFSSCFYVSLFAGWVLLAWLFYFTISWLLRLDCEQILRCRLFSCSLCLQVLWPYNNGDRNFFLSSALAANVRRRHFSLAACLILWPWPSCLLNLMWSYRSLFFQLRWQSCLVQWFCFHKFSSNSVVMIFFFFFFFFFFFCFQNVRNLKWF